VSVPCVWRGPKRPRKFFRRVSFTGENGFKRRLFVDNGGLYLSNSIPRSEVFYW
jgi:hypothetical protein